eukprot:Hpha_TRINITY_DN33772_c0_g1::TRINITY_DN33772_c0_g1_i1::g.24965::m.24965
MRNGKSSAAFWGSLATLSAFCAVVSQRRWGGGRSGTVPTLGGDEGGGSDRVALVRSRVFFGPESEVCASDRPVDQIRLWGERNSGTNLVWAVIDQNLNMDVDRSACDGVCRHGEGRKRFGGTCCLPPPGGRRPAQGGYNTSLWQAIGMKHIWPLDLRSYGAHDLAKYPPLVDNRYKLWAEAMLRRVMMVVVVREPLAWLVANHNIRHYYRPFGGHNMTRFIRTPWIDDLGNRFSSPMEWRRGKLMLFLELAKLSPHYHIARIEDFYDPGRQTQWVRRFACHYGLPLKDELKPVLKRVEHSGHRVAWAQDKKQVAAYSAAKIRNLSDGNVRIQGGPHVFTPSDCATVVQRIDWSLEREVGYILTGKALQRFCPLGTGGVFPHDGRRP